MMIDLVHAENSRSIRAQLVYLPTPQDIEGLKGLLDVVQGRRWCPKLAVPLPVPQVIGLARIDWLSTLPA